MGHRSLAEELFNNGCNCAQAVFVSFCDVTGLDRTTAMKLASSFGGGMGKLREVCGAVTGAFAVVGLLYGYSDVNDEDAKAKHYETVRRIAEEFSAKHGTYICRDLLEGIENTDGKDPAKRTPDYYAVRPCCRFVGDAAEIVDRIINERK